MNVEIILMCKMIGFIYKIIDNTNGNVYYGSTTRTIIQRMTGHRSQYERWVDGKRGGCKSFDIIKNEDYSCSIVEQVEFENKVGLLQRERWYIENNECVNKCVPLRSQEEKIEYHKEYNLKNKGRINERQREYNKENAEQRNERQKEYNKEHHEQRKEYNKQYQRKNREQLLEYQKQYRARKKAAKIKSVCLVDL